MGSAPSCATYSWLVDKDNYFAPLTVLAKTALVPMGTR